MYKFCPTPQRSTLLQKFLLWLIIQKIAFWTPSNDAVFLNKLLIRGEAKDLHLAQSWSKTHWSACRWATAASSSSHSWPRKISIFRLQDLKIIKINCWHFWVSTPDHCGIVCLSLKHYLAVSDWGKPHFEKDKQRFKPPPLWSSAHFVALLFLF